MSSLRFQNKKKKDHSIKWDSFSHLSGNAYNDDGRLISNENGIDIKIFQVRVSDKINDSFAIFMKKDSIKMNYSPVSLTIL